MKFQKKYDLGELAVRIQRARLSSPGEPPQFNAFEIEGVESILESCFGFHRAIPMADRRPLIRQGVHDAALVDAVTPAGLEQALKEAERAYLRRRPVDRIVASSLTFPYFPLLKRLRSHGGTITFSRELPRRFSRRRIQDDLDRVIAIKRADRLVVVRTRVRARTHAAAFSQAIDELDLVRGLWNLWINLGTAMRRTYPHRKAVNQILMGPVHTIHMPGGRLADEIFWYEGAHQQSEELYHMMEANWPKLGKWTSAVRRGLERVHYRTDLTALIRRYVRSLDTSDYEVAFSKLWSVLEHLVGAIGKYEVLIERTASFYAEADRRYARLILEHLRDVRNGLVHYDANRSEMETHLYQLKGFVELLIRFHLFQGSEFSSLGQAGEFLDLSPNVDVLREQIRIRQKAIRFHSPKA